MDNISHRIYLLDTLSDKVKDNNDCFKKNLILLAKGGSGEIFKKYIIHRNTEIEMALKFVNTDKFFHYKKYNYKNKTWKEYIILKKCNKLIKQHVTQHLPIIYDMNVCEQNNTAIFYNELASGDFLDWCQQPHSDIEWKSLLFQVWIAVYCLQIKLQLVHNDLRISNILFHKTEKSNAYIKYTINNTNYYLPNTGYVFMISDFGSAHMVEYEHNSNNIKIIEAKIKLNTDLHFFHDLYNRLQVLILYDRYTLTELTSLFTSDKDLKYYNEIKQEVTTRFSKSGRFDEKFKIGLIYYLMENNKLGTIEFDKHKDKFHLPPPEFAKILQELNTKYNYTYEDIVISFNPNMESKIPPIPVLINKYFSQYQVEQQHNLTFVI